MATSSEAEITQLPLISCMQKIVIYETKARFFVVGSNNTETRFRVLKIDRTESKDLVITDDKVEYTYQEIRDLLKMIDQGNRPKVQQKGSIGLNKIASAFGIVGFVRFLEGYYIILITKRRRVAMIGPHTIYKIDDTSMVYIPNETVRCIHPDETRYLKIFQMVDLSSNFYFSYSYDVSHTLQYNMRACKSLGKPGSDEQPEPVKVWPKPDSAETKILESPKKDHESEDANKSFTNFLTGVVPDKFDKSNSGKVVGDPEAKDCDEDAVYGVRMKPTYKYLWNQHLLKNFEVHCHPDWILYVIHGFIDQSNICIFGRPVYLTLIARRSNKFAGTRFLKRGANCEGFVANEVETEQIAHDASKSSLSEGHYTAFVQLRGSIPLHWSQDLSKMVPKPPITVDQSDPYAYIAGQHFNHVLRRYGSPIIILNLVKKREKKRHESLLTEEFVNAIKQLNQFLPSKEAIKYIGFDMARVSKSKSSNVLHRLAEIAEYCVKTTGFFQSTAPLHCNELRPHPRLKGMAGLLEGSTRRQQGVVRTNCVDCLDRTNTAQFAMGKCALAFQLHSLGVLDEPYLDFDSDCVRMLEELFEDQGDTLALQYGGSHLVHRIKGYRKIAPWTSNSRDIMQTLSRYYSNAFSDAEKQNAFNVFLGIFEPKEGKPNLWDLPTDFYLHNYVTMKGPGERERNYCQWWERPVVDHLPAAYEEESKGESDLLLAIKTHREDERVDGFWDYYKPYELTCMDEVYGFQVPNSIRDFMPKFSHTYSPFAVRVQPGRRQEESGLSGETNPNLSGKDSTSSISSTGSEGSTSSSDGSDLDGDIDVLGDSEVMRDDSGLSMVSLKDLFPTMAQTYGVEVKQPPKHNSLMYKRYVQIGNNARESSEPAEKHDLDRMRRATALIQRSMLPLDSSYSVEPPTVNQASKDIYQTYVKRGISGAGSPTKYDQSIYQQYLSNKWL